MIEIVTPEKAPLYARELEQSYRLRHQVFVEERGWDSWRKPDGRERDCYDPHASISFLAIEAGKVIACARLVPGGGLNPDLVTAEKRTLLKTRPDLHGLGRFCTASSVRGGPKRDNLASHLILRILEYTRDHGIPAIFFETDPSFIMLLRVLGIPVTAVGAPMPYYGRIMQMGLAEISDKALITCRARLKLTGAPHG